jgi:hypothetical protein
MKQIILFLIMVTFFFGCPPLPPEPVAFLPTVSGSISAKGISMPVGSNETDIHLQSFTPFIKGFEENGSGLGIGDSYNISLLDDTATVTIGGTIENPTFTVTEPNDYAYCSIVFNNGKFDLYQYVIVDFKIGEWYNSGPIQDHPEYQGTGGTITSVTSIKNSELDSNGGFQSYGYIGMEVDYIDNTYIQDYYFFMKAEIKSGGGYCGLISKEIDQIPSIPDIGNTQENLFSYIKNIDPSTLDKEIKGSDGIDGNDGILTYNFMGLWIDENGIVCNDNTVLSPSPFVYFNYTNNLPWTPLDSLVP